MKVWAGRFKKQLSDKVNDFNSSIAFDSRMYQQDIQGSIAHTKMLAAQGVHNPADAAQIIIGLQDILADLDSGELQFDADAEDIHSFVEAELTKRIGDNGKKLHTARSRNDQVATDFRLYCIQAMQGIVQRLYTLLEVLYNKAEQNVDTIMPGYTHLQRAQPISFAQHLLAYAAMFTRDVGRLRDCISRADYSPLGAGALAGTTYPIDRGKSAELLGFGGVCPNSVDAVSDRDYALECMSALAIIMMHLSRFAEDVILWCSQEFGFVELDDAYSTGSSIMPQKKNPDVAELVRGKTGRVYGDLMALLTTMKGLPMAYNKDMQEDKEAAFDALDTVDVCLDVFSEMLDSLAVNADAMRHAAARGFINSTDCADYLTKKGVPFRDAYRITGELVALCIEQSTTLEQLPMQTYVQAHEAFGEDVYQAISLDTCLNERSSEGGPAPQAVREQLRQLREILNAEFRIPNSKFTKGGHHG